MELICFDDRDNEKGCDTEKERDFSHTGYNTYNHFTTSVWFSESACRR